MPAGQRPVLVFANSAHRHAPDAGLDLLIAEHHHPADVTIYHKVLSRSKVLFPIIQAAHFPFFNNRY